jgi:hypothetical protein
MKQEPIILSTKMIKTRLTCENRKRFWIKELRVFNQKQKKKQKKNRTVGIIPKSNIKIVERGKPTNI